MHGLEKWGQTAKQVVGNNLLRHLADSFTNLFYTKGLNRQLCLHVISHLPLKPFHEAALRAVTLCMGDK